MGSIAVVCAGQGFQTAGMFDALEDAPAAATVFEAAAVPLGGKDPRAWLLENSEANLHANRAGQILCCTQALAAWAVIEDLIAPPIVIAGYSVGELAAWGVAGLFDVPTTLDLAAKRADAMDCATTEPSGLIAIRGLSRSVVETICEANGAYVAIVNATDRIVVGGTRAVLEAVSVAATESGAERTTLLAVAVASHTPLLVDASDRFRKILAGVELPRDMPVGVRLLSGIDGEAVFEARQGSEKLAAQVQQTIDWSACMEACLSAGVTKVIEIGPGNTLTRMMREVIPRGDIHSFSEFRSVAGFRTWAAKCPP